MARLVWGTRAYAVLLLLATTATASQAQTLTTLYSFEGGGSPWGLIQATDGNFYGTTAGGGAYGHGAVFKITPSGTLTTLYSFCSQNGCADGDEPSSGLIQATDGDFYGTTYYGGANGGTGTGSVVGGTIFKITPSGTLTTLYSFCSQSGCADSEAPTGGLVQATNGDFYGTTYGGQNGNVGSVFKITSSGTLTTLHTFGGSTDGYLPSAGLIQASDGNLYGTTYYGGVYGFGTVFQITPSGVLTNLYSFCNSNSDCTDGYFPDAGLIQASDGNFYGSTLFSGQYRTTGGGEGTVFKLTPSGALTTLHTFCLQSGCTDGAYPAAVLTETTDGNLYGTTTQGGANGNYGTVFKITPSGTLTAVYSFCSETGCTDGGNPGSLIQATDGNLYGTTVSGGGNGYGTVFRLSVGEAAVAPTVAWNPAPLTYGTPLGSAQLDARANTTGTFTYVPAAGTSLAAGPQTLMAIFTPADLVHFTSTTASVPLTVLPAPLTITANNAAVTVGAPLPGFTVEYAAFVGNDGPSSLGGSLAFSTSPAPVAGPGTYAIVPSGLTSYNYAITFEPSTLTVAYGVSVLFDQTKSVKSGATLPIKLQLVNATGADLSSSTITVAALALTQVSTGASDTVMDAGNANPDDDFRFDSTLGPTGGYIFNLKTTGLSTGTYALTFSVSGDPTLHQVLFQVR